MVQLFKAKYEVEVTNHRYSAGDKKNMPSVTTIIGAVNKHGLNQWSVDQAISEVQARLLAKLGEPVTEDLIADIATARSAHRKASREAADAGTEVHTKAASDVLLPGTALHRFVTENLHAKIVDVELPVASLRYGYGGTIDLVIEFGDESLGIIDWKSGKRGDYPEYAIQLGGYSIALAENYDRVVSRLMVVQLSNTAEPLTHFTVASIEKAQAAFQSVLFTYRYLNSGRSIWG